MKSIKYLTSTLLSTVPYELVVSELHRTLYLKIHNSVYDRHRSILRYEMWTQIGIK